MPTSDRQSKGRAREGRIVGEKSDAAFHAAFAPDDTPNDALIEPHRAALRALGWTEEDIAAVYPRRASVVP